MLNSSYSFGLTVHRDMFRHFRKAFLAHLQLFKKADSKKGALLTFF